jgi:hypothetical protein
MGTLYSTSLFNMRSDIFGLDFTRGDSIFYEYSQHEIRYIWFAFYTWDSIPKIRSDADILVWILHVGTPYLRVFLT